MFSNNFFDDYNMHNCFHPLQYKGSLPSGLNNPFDYDPDEVSLLACKALQASLPSANVEGKMYGVLVVEKEGELGYLAAYSGQIADNNGAFVPAVFDYLQPDGYFKQHEQEISQINAKIKAIETQRNFIKAKDTLIKAQQEADKAIEEQKQAMKISKALRDQVRKAGYVTIDDERALIKESQFLKAELHRKKLYYRDKIAAIQQVVNSYQEEIRLLQCERKLKSDRLQAWLFSQFKFTNYKGEKKDLCAIFRDYYINEGENTDKKDRSYRQQPPSGAGECCEPKLLQYAFTQGYKPIAMAMFWWGASPNQEIRQHGQFYPACNGKCKPILSWMLGNLLEEKYKVKELPNEEIHRHRQDVSTEISILFEDNYLAVIDKPAGLLSVPGKKLAASVYALLKQKWQGRCEPYMVHRLDMDTSGLMVVAKQAYVYHDLQQQFINRTVNKRYTAFLPLSLLDKNLPPKGKIILPLTADLFDRPRQKVDKEVGKIAITTYEIVGKTHYGEGLKQQAVRVLLYPHTGRTHQLRVHCAHSEGLGTPIIGDNLYGNKANRLHLYADRLRFVHPITHKEMTFSLQSSIK